MVTEAEPEANRRTMFSKTIGIRFQNKKLQNAYLHTKSVPMQPKTSPNMLPKVFAQLSGGKKLPTRSLPIKNHIFPTGKRSDHRVEVLRQRFEVLDRLHHRRGRPRNLSAAAAKRKMSVFTCSRSLFSFVRLTPSLFLEDTEPIEHT